MKQQSAPRQGTNTETISGKEPGKFLLSKRRRQEGDTDKHTSRFFDKETSSTFLHN